MNISQAATSLPQHNNEKKICNACGISRKDCYFLQLLQIFVATPCGVLNSYQGTSVTKTCSII